MFFKMGVLKIFANFTKKHPCWSLFLIKLQALFKNIFFYRAPPVAAFVCLTFPSIFLGRKSNNPVHPDYFPTITKVKSVSSQLSPHKAKKKSLNAVDRMSRRLKRTQERNQFLVTHEKCMNESITIEEQD